MRKSSAGPFSVSPAQLYGEFKKVFLNNAVEYFVSWRAGDGK